ncbi:hypothetical protein MMC10_005147 [Thelotrema lepadinum]|nr:hypothetical protein [Thelotrema lepadinum]
MGNRFSKAKTTASTTLTAPAVATTVAQATTPEKLSAPTTVNPKTDFDSLNRKTISPSKLAHVVFRTSNLKTMRTFYENFLGATTSFDDGTVAFMSYDDEHHRVAFLNLPDMGEQHRKNSGFEHVAFTFSTLEELLLSYRQRKALGIVPTWCVNHGPTTSMYYEDPDKNKIEAQYDNFDTETAYKYMHSDAFANNAIGVDFDPEDLIERIKKGESLESLTRRPDMEEPDPTSALAGKL